VLDIRNWMLTLPEAAAGSMVAVEIKQPQLASFADAYFHIDPAGDGVVFTAPAGGATTEGSSYPRAELREMTANGTRKASWSTDRGVNSLVVTEAVTGLPMVKPQVVTAQIHDASNDVIEILADGSHPGRGGSIQLAVRYGGQVQPVRLDDAYVPGTRYTVTLTAANGQIRVAYDGLTKLVFTTSRSGLYFKAGAYTQSNTTAGDAPTAVGQVVIYALKATHAE
jgi:poly(beta-D-mannuronate) lyase